jgi:hypothetical protein
MHSTRWFCSTKTKIEFFTQVVTDVPEIKFRENPLCSTPDFLCATDRQTLFVISRTCPKIKISNFHVSHVLNYINFLRQHVGYLSSTNWAKLYQFLKTACGISFEYNLSIHIPWPFTPIWGVHTHKSIIWENKIYSADSNRGPTRRTILNYCVQD